MTETAVFILAEQTLADVIAQIKADQWTMKLPPWFQLGGTQDRNQLTLKNIINYHAYDTAWVPEVLAGRTIDEVGSKYDGDLLGDNVSDSYRNLSQIATSVVADFKELDKIVHLSYGDWPAREYLQHITSFRGFRAYDIAKLIGIGTKLPDDLVQGMWELFSPHFEEWRQMGVFGPAVVVSPNADLQTKLLAQSGRS